jgi:large subunit ribosomal protein L1
MAKVGKRIKEQRKKVEALKVYPLDEACGVLVSTKSTKFDETVDIAIRLGIDARKTEQAVRGSVAFPNGLGKTVRVAVFAKGEKAQEAQAAGADLVGAEDLVEKIKAGFMDFDALVATPDMMAQVGKVGKQLGPRGLMPSPKVGTVTFDVAATVKMIKAGRSEFRADKAGILHVPVGKASFGPEKIKENIMALMTVVNKSKPSTSKGVYLRAASMSLTMGPGVRFDLTQFRS